MRYNKQRSKDALGCKARSVFAFLHFYQRIRRKPERPGAPQTQRGVPAGLYKRDALFFSFFTGGAKAERSA